MKRYASAGKNHVVHKIVQAGRAFRAVEGKDPATEGRALADWLRSGAEIGELERDLLAELVTGGWRKSPGRPKRVGPEHPYAQAVVEFYMRRNAKLGPRKTKIAKDDTAKEFGECVRTIERYLKDARELSERIKRAKVSVAKY